MVEGHVSFRACGFESRSGHNSTKKAAIFAAFFMPELLDKVRHLSTA
jgi:hypothetical protein